MAEVLAIFSPSVGFGVIEQGVQASVASGISTAIVEGDVAGLSGLLQRYRGANMCDARCAGGTTPLHLAATHCREEMIELLLAHGAVLQATDTFQRTAVHLAAMAGSVAGIAVLSGVGADINCVDILGRTPLHLAAMNGEHGVLRALIEDHGASIDMRDMNQMNALHCCAAGDHHEIAMTLLSNKADPDALDANGQTPLHMAAAASAIDLTNVLLRLRHPELPPGLTALDWHGRSPLRLAVGKGSVEVVAALLRAGAARSYLEHLEVRTDQPAAPPPDAAFELFKAALWDTTRRRGQIADRDLRVVDMLLAAGWDLVVTRNMLLLAAALRSRVAIEVLSTEPTRAYSATAASKVPSLQVLCRKTGRRQLGPNLAVIDSLDVPQSCKSMLVYDVPSIIVPSARVRTLCRTAQTRSTVDDID